MNPWVKWLHISHVFQWWFSPPLWVVALDHCQDGLFNPALGKKPIPFCQCLQKLSHVHPWNPPFWRFSQIKLTFCVSFFFLIVNSSHTNTIKLYEVRHNSSLPEVTACELQGNVTTHIISTWWKVSLEQRVIVVWGEPHHQAVLGWGSIFAGHKPRLGPQMWCQLAVWPKACSFTRWISHLFMCGYPFLPEWFGRFREAKIGCVWYKSRQQVSPTWLPDIRNLGRNSGHGMEELLCHVPPCLTGRDASYTSSVLPCLLCENCEKSLKSVNLGYWLVLEGF